jgi:hypothetical protein
MKFNASGPSISTLDTINMINIPIDKEFYPDGDVIDIIDKYDENVHDSDNDDIYFDPDNVDGKIYMFKFMSSDECDSIIESVENAGFEESNYNDRDASRVIFIEKRMEEILTKRVDKIMSKSKFDRYFRYAFPYGFYDKQYGMGFKRLNPCFRVSKYVDSNGFAWHRDAQYTERSHVFSSSDDDSDDDINVIKQNTNKEKSGYPSQYERSAYSLVVFLTDNDDGELSFILNKPVEQKGYTIKQELEMLGELHTTSIKPTKGYAVMFDQKLIHMANNVSGTKYVMRTDLVYEQYYDDYNPHELSQYDPVRNFTKQLFRQAELLEVFNTDRNDLDINRKISEIYEICTSIRMSNIESIDELMHLTHYLEPIQYESGESTSVKLLSYSGGCYEYETDPDTDSDIVTIIALIQTIVHYTSMMYGVDIDYDDFISKLCANSGVDPMLCETYEKINQALYQFINNDRIHSKINHKFAPAEEFSFDDADYNYHVDDYLRHTGIKYNDMHKYVKKHRSHNIINGHIPSGQSIFKSHIKSRILNEELSCKSCNGSFECMVCTDIVHEFNYQNPRFDIHVDIIKDGIIYSKATLMDDVTSSLHHAACRHHYLHSTKRKRKTDMLYTLDFDIEHDVRNNRLRVKYVPVIVM